MTILLDIRDPDWLEEQELKNRLQSQLPGVDILCNDPGDQAGEVTQEGGERASPSTRR